MHSVTKFTFLSPIATVKPH